MIKKPEKNEKRFYDKLLELIEPYMYDFLGYNEETQSFDIILACKEILEMERKE